jgi:nicotinate-nucleotide adenylyltransferase
LRIGIFGGTFDPIHAGHLRAAEAVRRRFGLDRILFVPSNTPPHKRRPSVAPAPARLKMVELAVRGRRGFEANAIEVRSRSTSYSVITIEKIGKLFPGARLFFILGADAFLEIKTWREWRRVLDLCALIVMTRPGTSLRAARSVLQPEYRSRMISLRPATKIGPALAAGRTIFFLRIDALPVSSTDIRRRIREGRSIDVRVPDPVAAAIGARKLYQEQKP